MGLQFEFFTDKGKTDKGKIEWVCNSNSLQIKAKQNESAIRILYLIRQNRMGLQFEFFT